METKQVKNLFSIILIVLMESCLLGTLFYMHFEPAWIAVIGAVSLTGCVIHIRRAMKDAHYMGKLLGTVPKGSGRIPQLDHLRVIAVMGVILTHTVQVDIGSYKPPVLYLANMLWVLTMAANVIYVMLSGALLYRWKQESLRRFYLRRIAIVAVPLAIYYLWYTAVRYHLGRGWQWVSLTSVPHWLLANEMRETPHLWLVYTILSIYVTVPLFRVLLRNVAYRDLTKTLGAVFAFTVLAQVLLPYAKLAVELPFTGWLLVSLIGYWVCLEESRKYDRWLIGLGLVAGMIICVLTVYNPDSAFLSNWCLNARPLPMLLCTGIFALVFHLPGYFSRMNPLVRCISHYSYGIILIHWWALHNIVRDTWSISSMRFHYLGTPLSLVLVLAISLLFCLIVDNLLVMPVQFLFDIENRVK